MATNRRKRTISKLYLVVGVNEILTFTTRTEADQMKMPGEKVVPIRLNITSAWAVNKAFFDSTQQQ